MMTTIGGIYFSFCALLCVLGALITVLARNPIRGALGLLSTIVGIAGLFLLLRAQFLAAIQIIVYAGAVVVLFVFVLILLGTEASDPGGSGKAKLGRATAGAVLLALVIGAFLLLAPELAAQTMAFSAANEAHGSVAAVGAMLFGPGIVPFELATSLLIVAVVGAVAMARNRGTKKVTRRDPHATRRLFHGPVHPRDAGIPFTKGTYR
jgi:NADH-quinone oxidoreductase subunit J